MNRPNVYIHSDYEDRRGLLAKALVNPGTQTLTYTIDKKATDAQFTVRLMNNSGGTIKVRLWMASSAGAPKEVDIIEPEIELKANAVYHTTGNHGSSLERLFALSSLGSCIIRAEGVEFRKDSGVKVNGHWFHTDSASRIQQMALSAMGG